MIRVFSTLKYWYRKFTRKDLKLLAIELDRIKKVSEDLFTSKYLGNMHSCNCEYED